MQRVKLEMLATWMSKEYLLPVTADHAPVFGVSVNGKLLDIDIMPQQTDVISFIPAGGEESFRFTEVADYLLLSGQKTPEMPEKLEVVIESFEIAE